MRISTRPLLTLGALAALGLALALLLAIRQPATAGGAGQAAATPLDFRFSWPRGSTYLYDVAWTLEQTSRLGDAPVTGRLALGGQVELRSYGEHDGVTVLGVHFTALSRAEVRLGGQPLLGSDAAAASALLGPEAFIEVEPTGLVRALYLAPGEHELFAQLVQNLVGELEVVVPAEARAEWTVTAHSSAGAAEVRYAAHAGQKLERHALRYTSFRLLPGGQGDDASQKLTSSGQVVLAPEGHLASLGQDERLGVRDDAGAELASSADHLQLKLISVGRFDPGAGPALAQLARRLPGEIAASADADRRLLEARADGMTGEQLLSDLAMQAAAGRMLDHSRWMWRAVAVLRLHPELCAELIPLFDDAQTGIAGRALLLDLLASTGSGEAQAAMRTMLRSRVATGDGRYGELLQRTSVLEQPDVETVALVREVAQQASEAGDADLAHAAVYALGATGGRSRPEEGARVSAELRDGLAHAETGDDRAVFVMALGNSSRDEDLAVIRPLLYDPDPQVRRAAVDASFQRAGDFADDLLDVLGDPDQTVQRDALTMLGRTRLDAAQLERLSAVVLSGVIPAQSDGVLLGLLTIQLRPGRAMVDMLRYVIARQTDQPDLQARARTLLAQLGSAS